MREGAAIPSARACFEVRIKPVKDFPNTHSRRALQLLKRELQDQGLYIHTERFIHEKYLQLRSGGIHDTRWSYSEGSLPRGVGEATIPQIHHR